MVSHGLFLFRIKKLTSLLKEQTPCHSTFSDGIICGPHWGSFVVRDHLRSNLGIITGLGIICGRGSLAVLLSYNMSTFHGSSSRQTELTRLITKSTDKHYSLVSEDDSDWRNTSHQKQFFSELPSPRLSLYATYVYIYSFCNSSAVINP